MLDSRFGKNSFLALHFLKKSVGAVIVPLNVLYAERLCDKVRASGFRKYSLFHMLNVEIFALPVAIAEYAVCRAVVIFDLRV